MKPPILLTRAFRLGLVVLLFFLGCEGPPGPRINDRFSIKEGSVLSPPIVQKPIHECAEIVHVHGFVPHATVKVYANQVEQIGEAIPPFGYADIPLTRHLKLGESVTATQTVNGLTSTHSIQPVIVSAYPTVAGGFNKPVVGKDIFECGVLVPVDKLVPSVRVHVFEEGVEVGSDPAAGEWVAVWTKPLHAGMKVTAQQIACEEDSSKMIKSPLSDPVTVKPAPNPMPSPSVDPNSLYAGNDAVTLGNLYVGARITIYDNGTPVTTNWYANGGNNWFPVNKPLTANSVVTATQELCGNTSPPSDPVKPAGELKAPLVVGPICKDAQFVVIRNTTINANVVVLRNNTIVGYGGAVNGDLVLGLGGNVHLATGDVITAYQYFGSTISPVSNSVTVTASLAEPFVEITGGEPFFLAEANEHQIDGPVFPRGKGKGATILVQACCVSPVKVEIRGPSNELVSELEATEVFPGYYSALWDWSSKPGWSVPSGIPVGKYTVTIRTGCDQQEAKKVFYVIFNPDDVGGPSRFSYNETGVWFGTLTNQTRALLYHLHPDDWRVFSVAIQAANGLTDPLKAAAAISDAEEAKFSYSLSYHTNDVLDLLQNYTEAQCADDANFLAAYLRSVGIPAHPATADAGLETGAANWTFDTWTEFLVPTSNGNEWLILHPHEYPTMNAESRNVFGTTRGVATKAFNDIIVMANENWNWSEASDNAADVSFKRNACAEPEQHLTKKAWIGELCEGGYWSQNHWDCGGTGSSSSPLTAEEGFRVDMGNAGYGRSIAGVFTYVNRENRRITGELTVEVVSDLPESKRFPDETSQRKVQTIMLGPNEKVSIPFELKLPPTLSPGYELLLHARLNKRTLAVHPFKLPDLIKTELRTTDSLRLDGTVSISALVTNVSKQIVNGVDVTLVIPYALDVRDKLTQRVDRLNPGEEKRFTWTAHVSAPLEAGSVQLKVATVDGGPATSAVPITIPDTQRGVVADPGKMRKK